MTLTVTKINSSKPLDKPYKLADSGGLYLLVHNNGSKYWRLKYRYAGKEKLLALSQYPMVSLAEARLKRDEAKRHLLEGYDPSAVKRKKKRVAHINTGNSFQSVSLDWWNHQKGRWTESHAKRVWNCLEVDVFPLLGSLPITEIETVEVLAVVRKVESRGALDVASRVLQRCSSVFRFAVQTGVLKYNPANDLVGVLQQRKPKHRLALTRAELPGFMKALRAYDGHVLTRLALNLLVLTFVRPAELRFARWDEFDFNLNIWRIPAARMKMGTEHIVPLSRQVIDLIQELKTYSGQYDLLFPGERSRAKPISDNTMIYAMYRVGYKSRATPHGFRTSASSILNEEGFNPDAIERQLSHMERNKIRGAYTQHAEYLAERTRMMKWWGDYLQDIEFR
jgi:integrase